MQPTLNGIAPSWSDIALTLNVLGGGSSPQVDWKSIDWDSKVERGEQRGVSGGRVLKRTTGSKTDTATAEVYRSGLRDLKRALMTVAPKDDAGRPMLSKVTFDLIIQHSFEDDPSIYEVQLKGCHLDGTTGKHAEGNDAETVPIALNPIEIVEKIDGVDTVLL